MQLLKDVLIAGGVVVVCVALVIVALVATGKKDQPAAEPMASGESYGSPAAYAPPTSFGSDPMGAPPGGPSDPYAAPAPPMGSAGQTGGSAFGGGSPLAQSPVGLGPAPGGMPDPMPVSAGSTGGGTHTVAKNETLGDISAAHYGTTKHWRKIVEANPGLDPARLKIGQVLQIPAVETAPVAAAPVAGGADTYTVKKGESYYTIAKKALGSSSRWREIERLNNIPAEELRAGTVIKLPAKENAGAGPVGLDGAIVAGGKTHVVGKGETLGDISKQYFGTTTKWKQIVEANPGVRPENLKVGQSLAIPDLPSAGPDAAPAAAVGGNAYTVKAGDTLETIALSTMGKKSAWKQIVEANPGLKPTSLRVGQVISIPGGTVAPTGPLAPSGSDFTSPAPAGGLPPRVPVPAPAPQPTYKDDPFFSPYDSQPAPAPSGAPRPLGAIQPALGTGV